MYRSSYLLSNTLIGLTIAFLGIVTVIFSSPISEYVALIFYKSNSIEVSRFVYRVLILLLLIIGTLFTFFGFAWVFVFLIYKEDATMIYKKVIFKFLEYSELTLFILVSCSVCICLCGLLLSPESFFNSKDKNYVATGQIISCVCLSGIFGGISREVILYSQDFSLGLPIKKILLSTVTSLFVSFTSFLLIRAGILKSGNIDSFNPFGITGISALTGYFSDKIVSRLSNLYQNLLGSEEKKTIPK